MAWYRPGPGVLARSSAKLPVVGRPAMEKAEPDALLGTLLPIREGRVYEFGDG